MKNWWYTLWLSGLFLVCIFPQRSNAQPREITFLEILEKAAHSKSGERLNFNNYAFDNSSFKFQYLFEYFERLVDPGSRELEDGRLIIPTTLTFRNCHFKSIQFDRIKFTGELKFFNCTFDQSIQISNSLLHNLLIQNSSFKDLTIIDASFEDYCVIQGNSFDNLELSKTAFYGVNWFVNDVASNIHISNCVFHPVKNGCVIVNDSIGYNRPIYNNLQLSITNLNRNVTPNLSIVNSKFLSDTLINKVNIQADLLEILMENNLFESSINMHGSSIDKRLIFRNNRLENYIGFNDVIFAEFFNMVEWEQFAGNKLCIFELFPIELAAECPNNYGYASIIDDTPVLYLAENEEELENQNSYRLLISIYQKLLNIYKSNGDIKSGNGCYSEMKDVQSRMLKHRFAKKKNFDNFFRWKLAQLLKVYVNYGTDPARAITISVWVVLIFGIFYFFFPSEWDSASKSKLVNDFKEIIEENDKGYFKPFLSLIFGFLISLLNALTLSLNSFVTLGFGNIPTSGLARYICILQGFIGWFLLSIFTVALINQVLT